jgi:hypothetical protein
MYYENPDGVAVHMGFPNPAVDASLQSLDLNKLLIRNSLSTYLMRIEGHEWRDAGIFDGALVLIDRALKAAGNDLVIWWEGDTFTISPHHAVPSGTPTWGVVTATIQQFRSKS